MNATEKLLDGKIAIVTGAGRGIGKAIAIAYAKAGASIGCLARTETEIKQTASEIINLGGKVIAVSADVSDFESMRRLCEKVNSEFGGIDILVINAAINLGRESVEESSPDKWQKTIDVNLMGAYYSAKAAIPYMKQRGAGKIIAIGSGLGHKGFALGSAYACSKAALWMFTRILAQEVYQYNISVNELIPGPVKSKMNPRGPASPSEWYKEADDIVPLALFLASQPDIGPTAQSFSLCRRDI